MIVLPAPVPPERNRPADELTVTTQRLEVALAVVGMFCQEVDDLTDRRLIVADVVDQWRALSPQLRAVRSREAAPFPPLTHFAWEYVAAIEDGDADAPGGDYDEMLFRAWRTHVERLRRQWSPSLVVPAR